MIPIYKAELDAGLKEAFADNCIAFCSLLKPSEVNKEEFTVGVKDLIRTEADEQFDLYPLDTILVSTGWNKNHDVFDKLETWAARKTPVHKPINVGHDQTKIRGHITASVGISSDGKIIPDDAPIEDIPDFFNILTSAFLYKVWKPTEIQKEMETIIAEIALGEWFVSMECLFKGFDYAVIDKDGGNKVLARSESTAFLTKHLRAYGGTGEYDGRQIGRLLRNITFSGKGLVKNPANPHSIILNEKFVGSNASLEEIKGEIMAERNYETEIKELKDSLKLAETKLAEASVKDFSGKVEALTQEKKELSDRIISVEASKKEVEDKLTKTEATVVELTGKLTEVEASLKTNSDELNKIRAEAKKVSRIALVKEKGKTVEEAEAFYTKFEAIDDKTFAEIVSLISTPEKVEKKVEEVVVAEVTKTELETVVTDPTLTAETKVENASAAVVADAVKYLKEELKKETK